MKDYYFCENCGEDWGYEPEDWGSDSPTRCPFCSMSVFQMIHDTYKMGGIREVLYWLKARYL